ncbi:iron-binding protein, partial [Cladochytrium tenue]
MSSALASAAAVAASSSVRRSAVPALAAAAAAATPASRRGYHEKVIDHYENPRNVGSLSKADPNVGTGIVGAPACGDVMKLQILVDDVTGEIKDVKFKTFGCGSAIASSSLATEKIKGLSVWDAAKIKNTDIAKELALPP